MGNPEFRKILSAVRRLSAEQRTSLMRTLQQLDPGSETLQGRPRACPHCEHRGIVGWGSARGLKRWRCKGCERTFTAVTGTGAHGLRYREVWPEFATALMDGETLNGIARRCGIHRTTAHRWRTRFLQGLVGLHPDLAGIVEADETYLLRSAKGQKKVREAWGRPARKRGGTATKRGLSREQVPVFMATDRGGKIACQVSDGFDAERASAALRGVVAEDAVLCSDGHGAYVSAARQLGLRHERIVHADGGRVRGAFHIQNINSEHSRFKTWIRRFNGVSTSRLPLYAAWFARIERIEREARAPSRILDMMLTS
jgi:transposase-like protein